MLFARLRAGEGLLAFFDDDYFYYLCIARNIAAGHGSTFDGVHLTNGYHPLWMLVNTVLVKLFVGHAFFLALLTVIFVGVLAVYWFTYLCFRKYGEEAAAASCAGLIAAEALLVMRGGMEVVLALPFLALLCWFRLCRFNWHPGKAFIYGLLCAAMVLSRLDTAILVALLVLFELYIPSTVTLRRKALAGAWFAIGLFPVGLYFISNSIIFHTFLPISGQAKQLRFSHVPSSLPFSSTFIPREFLHLALSIPLACAALVAMLLLSYGAARPAEGKALTWALLCFPFVHLAVFSIVSDWQFWRWYLYTFVAAGIGTCFTVLSRNGKQELLSNRLLAPLATGAMVTVLVGYSAVEWRRAAKPQLEVFSIYLGAQDLKAFGRSHPGTYAMGDRAGTPGFLVDEAIVQTEGLVMDKAFLANIRQQRSLKQVLEYYGVRYYVTTNPTFTGKCFRAIEPRMAGPSSYVMHGTFCSTPVLHVAHNEFDTYVFDMNHEKMQAANK